MTSEQADNPYAATCLPVLPSPTHSRRIDQRPRQVVEHHPDDPGRCCVRVAGLLPPQVRGILSSTIQRDSEHSLTDLHSPAFQILRSQAVGSLHVPRHALMSASTSQFSRISITRDDAVATGGSLAQLRRLLLVHGSPAAATACRSTYPLHLPAVACRRVSIGSLTVIACMYHSPLSYLNWDSGVPGTPDCRRVLVRCERSGG